MELDASLSWLALALTPGLGRDLAARGLVILSGMARGIDALGHHGALASNGRAIGVLGTGIDVCYPERKQKALRKSFGAGRYPERVPPRSASCARELPHQESHCHRYATWGDCVRRGRV